MWSPNGDTLAASDQSTVRFVRSDGTPVFERKIDGQASVRGPSGPSSTVRFTANGETVAIVERKQVVLVRRDGTPLKTVTFDPPVDDLQGNWFWWSSDSVRMTTLRKQGEKGGNLMTRDLETGDARKLSEFPDEIDSADCSPDGKRLLTGYNGGEWELQHLDQSEAPTLSARGHLNGTILGAAFSHDGRRFATGGWDAMIRLWSLEGVCLQSLAGHGMPIQSLSWSADDKRLLSRGRDRSMRVWSVATGRPELIFTALADGTWLILTANGRLIGGSQDGIARTFLFLVEQLSGTMEIVDYPEFLKRARPTTP